MDVLELCAKIRRDALEEAAKVCDAIAGEAHNADPSGDIARCAETIRALIEAEPSEEG